MHSIWRRLVKPHMDKVDRLDEEFLFCEVLNKHWEVQWDWNLPNFYNASK
jgi:hypothetical protein